MLGFETPGYEKVDVLYLCHSQGHVPLTPIKLNLENYTNSWSEERSSGHV